MKQLTKFIPFAKVDAAKREVSGIVTAEVVDKSGETCHYDSTKKLYQSWSSEFQKATDGKSFGNLRRMHTLDAVGKGTEIDFRDDDKEIWMTFKVTDDRSWNDIEEGVMTGFSQGGNVVKAWKENGHKYYTAEPAEVSLVDNPCLSVCHFAYVKGDGAVEMRKLRSADVEATGATEWRGVDIGELNENSLLDLLKTAPVKEYLASLLPQAAPPKSAAWQELTKKAAAARPLVQGVITDVRKGMSAVGGFAQLLAQLKWLYEDTQWEAEREADESPVPQDLLDRLKDLCAVFLDMAKEEVSELTEPSEGGESFAFASFAEMKKTSALLRGAVQQLDRKQAGTPAQGATMSDLAKAKTGLMDHLKKAKEMSDDHHEKMQSHLDKCVDCVGGDGDEANKTATPVVVKATTEPVVVPVVKAAEPVVAPVAAVIASPVEGQFTDMLKGMQTQFQDFMENLNSSLAPPKAKATGTGRPVTKSQDGVSPGQAATPPPSPIVFQPVAGASMQVSDDYRKAMRSSLNGGVALAGGPEDDV